ncbi:MAG: hypothetical protein NTW76_11670 [Corynebacteriales bacterium]|nr:hypothetical protein [Mycobacteriales bacterium]
MEKSARAAGQALIDQDDESQRSIANALKSTDGIDPLTKLTTGNKEYPLPRSNDPLAGVSSMLKSHGAPQAGPFPMGVAPEPIPNFNLDPALAALGPAVPGTLTTLAQQWAQLAQKLQAAFSNFDAHISILGTEVFSGEAASKMKQSMTQFSDSGKRISDKRRRIQPRSPRGPNQSRGRSRRCRCCSTTARPLWLRQRPKTHWWCTRPTTVSRSHS